jgi:hypothetical protein
VPWGAPLAAALGLGRIVAGAPESGAGLAVAPVLGTGIALELGFAVVASVAAVVESAVGACPGAWVAAPSGAHAANSTKPITITIKVRMRYLSYSKLRSSA